MAMGFAPEIRKMKSECWQSRWRPCAWDENDRPTAFVALTQTEMMEVAATGRISIPDEQLPASALIWRDLQKQRDLDTGLPKASGLSESLAKAVDRMKGRRLEKEQASV